MLTSSAIYLASEGGAESGIVWGPYIIGGATLFVLLFALVALMAFGSGREHS